MGQSDQPLGLALERGVRPLCETARPLAWMSREGVAELQGCNGVSVWCESAALYEHPAEAHPSLMPVYDLSVAEAWRAFGLHAEREREVLKAALLQAQNAAIALTHQDTQRRAEYEDLQQSMRNMTRNHALQLDRQHDAEMQRFNARWMLLPEAVREACHDADDPLAAGIAMLLAEGPNR
jgi:hypothetical protein